MGIIVDLYPALPRRMYLSRPRLVEAAPLWSGRRRFASTEANAPLGCLTGGALASRFHGWHGGSGQRYVCSVYPVLCGEPQGGLPDLDDAVVIAVACGRGRERSRVAIFEACWRDGELARESEATLAAVAREASEWHIHLLAESPEARRAAIRDLETG
jgi:hypothetical protein